MENFSEIWHDKGDEKSYTQAFCTQIIRGVIET